MSKAGLGQYPALAELVFQRGKLGLHGLLAEVAGGLRHHIQQRGNHRSASTRRLAVGLGLEHKVVRIELLAFGEIGCHCGGCYLGGHSYLQRAVERMGQLASRQELLLLGLHYEWHKLTPSALRNVQ